MTEVSYGLPGRIQTVEEAWGDWNGHLNMAYYNVLFDRAIEDFLAAIGITEASVAEGGGSSFTLEAHVTYLRELMVGDQVRVWTRILDWDAKRVHVVQSMEKRPDGFIAATSENMMMHVSMQTRRGAPYPPAVAEKLAAMAQSHADLPVPGQVGHKIGIPHKQTGRR